MREMTSREAPKPQFASLSDALMSPLAEPFWQIVDRVLAEKKAAKEAQKRGEAESQE